jgi:hypothetical protein
MKLLIMQSSPFSRHFLPVRSIYSPQHPVPKHPQSVFLLGVKDQISRSYKTGGKIRVLYILIFGGHPASCPLDKRGSLVGIKRPERQADHSPPSNAEVKE